MNCCDRAAPRPKPETSQKGHALTSTPPALQPSGTKRHQGRGAPTSTTVHWLLGGPDAGQAIQRKPVDAGYGDIVAAAGAPRLRVSQPGDRLESEADRVAEHVMRMPDPPRGTTAPGSGAPRLLQRKCARCDEEEKLHRKGDPGAAAGMASAEVPASVHDTLGSPGRPLDPDASAFASPRFGHDFRDVRVHTDQRAADSARDINALAYTVGHHVVFGEGQYAPGTSAGRRVLAHELTHVIQQGGAKATAQRAVTMNSDSGDGFEREAESIATQFASQEPASPVRVEGRLGVARLQRLVGPCADVATPHRLLIHGSVHPSVREAQRKLNAFHSLEVAAGRPGLTDAPLVEDCVFGDHTFNATLSFQRQKFPGVPAEHDGKIGDHTWAQLDASSSPPPPPPPPPAPPTGCVAPLNPDESGRAFNPTTDSQAAVIASHPLDAFTVNTAASESFAAAGASGLPGAHLGPQDAFRHCVWSCLMTQRIGAIEAEQFATGHENSGPSSIPFDNEMDLHDNSIGRSLGAPGADCPAACRDAVATGRLRSIRGVEADGSASAEGLAPATPTVTPTCMGASNQPWP